MGQQGSKDVTDGHGKGGRTIGVSYSGHMTGHLHKNGADHPCELDFTMESVDVALMLDKDTQHKAHLSGKLTCKSLLKEPVSFTNGKCYVQSSTNKNLEFKSMVYEASMNWDDHDYFFKGVKVCHQDTFVEDNATDATSLGIVIKDGPTFGKTTWAAGQVETKLVDLAKEIAAIKISGCEDDELKEAEWKARFGYFIGGVLLDVSNLFSPTQFCPKAVARERRPLNLKGVKPEIYNLTAKDGVPLVMTRYRCGTKGPILFLHGLCVTSRIFSLDTIDMSVVEYFAEHGYDMWVVELRFSVSLPSHRKPTHINDSAERDLPPIVDFILKTTECPDLQVYAHCIGSLTIHTALFGGHIQRHKVRSLVASQSGFCMISTSMNHAKANVRLEKVATAFGFAGLNAYTDDNDHPREKLMSAISQLLVRSTLNKSNQCSNVVCNRITSMFGLMWEHRNLNKLTHDTLTEWFGFGHAEYYRHLSVTFRKGRLTDIKGRDVYIPDFNSKNRLESAKYRKAMTNLDLPILYYVGSLNQGWDIDATRQSYNRCREANPHQHYEWFEVPEYGHLDCVMGQNACKDVYPRILPFLEKFSTPASSDRLI
ncbi:lipase lipl-1-like [Diadema setosum]|uniref:lipase lipl-1-like n=1 Tax=Diadema setosum TaxID=31175 RepID=UPI003B3A6848